MSFSDFQPSKRHVKGLEAVGDDQAAIAYYSMSIEMMKVL